MTGPDELGDSGAGHEGPRPAPAGSQMGRLRQRRADARAALHLDLAVPRYEPPIYVRLGPVDQGRLQYLSKRAEKSKAPDAMLVLNAAILAESCVGIFEVIDKQQVSVDETDRAGEWPCFDERLAAVLGVEVAGPVRATDLVRELYLTDGDIIASATKLTQWSGYSTEELEQADAPGN